MVGEGLRSRNCASTLLEIDKRKNKITCGETSLITNDFSSKLKSDKRLEARAQDINQVYNVLDKKATLFNC